MNGRPPVLPCSSSGKPGDSALRDEDPLEPCEVREGPEEQLAGCGRDRGALSRVASSTHCGGRSDRTVRYSLGKSNSPLAVAGYTFDALPADEQEALPAAAERMPQLST